MIVEKIDYIKTGDFSLASNSEIISELKFRAFYLSKLKHIAPDRLMEALRKEVQLELVEEDYETHLPEDYETHLPEDYETHLPELRTTLYPTSVC